MKEGARGVEAAGGMRGGAETRAAARSRPASRPAATMNAYRSPPLLSTAVGSFVCLIWILYNVSTRMLICNFLSGCVDIFFRQVAVAGAHKLHASDCPLLVAIAPHSNQFIDPMIVLK